MTEIAKLKGKEVCQTYFITTEDEATLHKSARSQDCKTKYRKWLC